MERGKKHNRKNLPKRDPHVSDGSDLVDRVEEEVVGVQKSTDYADESEIRIMLTPKRRRRSNSVLEQQLEKTPKAQAELVNTPRRSSRKSIKPAQDYEEIVNRKSLRSAIKNIEKQSSIEEDLKEDVVGEEIATHSRDKPKWTPAKVGRVSEKRKTRKAKRSLIAKKGGKDAWEKEDADEEGEKIQIDADVLEVIANDEDENKENVEPQELKRNRKSPKDMKRRSNEVLGSIPCVVITPAEESLNAIGITDMAGLEPLDVVDDVAAQEGNKSEVVLPVISNSSTDDIISEVVNITTNIRKDGSLKKLEEENSSNLIDNGASRCDVPIISAQLTPEDKKFETENNNDTLNSSDCMIISPIVSLSAEESLNLPTHVEKSDWVVEALIISDDEEETMEAGQKEAKQTKAEQPVVEQTEAEQPVVEQTEAERMQVKEYKAEVNKIEENQIETKMEENQIEIEVQQNKSNTNDAPNLTSNMPDKRSVTPNGYSLKRAANGAKTPTTPQRSALKPYRFPTPYARKLAANTEFSFNKHAAVAAENISSAKKLPTQQSILGPTNMDPKDVVLRSIRKRSMSVSNESHTINKKKKVNRVKFHSPANQTALIEELDMLIVESTKKENGSQQRRNYKNNVALDTSNVTKRRRRSFSLDESMMDARWKSKALLTPTKQRTTPQKLQPRTKIPNFAAIHQRQFNKMENVIDHVQRKAERAKELINSSSKVRPTAQRNINVEAACSTSAAAAAANTAASALSGNEENTHSNLCILPDPSLFRKNIAIVQPLAASKKMQPTATTAAAATHKTIFNATQHHQARPPFNLSTNVGKSVSNSNNCSLLDRAEASAAASALHLASKMSTRRQRHMDMFKGRGAVTSGQNGGVGGAGVRGKDKPSEIIRGVRSNRRFDLQMEHRRNLNTDHV